MTPIQHAVWVGMHRPAFKITFDARECKSLPKEHRKDNQVLVAGEGLSAPILADMGAHGVTLHGLRFSGKFLQRAVYIPWDTIQAVATDETVVVRPDHAPQEPSREPEEKPTKGGLRLV